VIALLLADAVVLLHLTYIAYVVGGALLVLRRPGTVWVHLVAVAWAVWIAASGGICPLTPLEVRLRVLAGEAGYSGGFVTHYILPVLYPAGLTRGVQAAEAAFVIAVNVALYAWVWSRRGRPVG
jgi:Protein of Unknown function (DUF2784)